MRPHVHRSAFGPVPAESGDPADEPAPIRRALESVEWQADEPETGAAGDPRERLEALVAWERELEERVGSTSTKRNAALERREARLARRERELELARADVKELEGAVRRRAEEVARNEREVVGAPGRTWNLVELRGLVDARADAHPDRVDEWSSYLTLLGDYADAKGDLPRRFDQLVEDVFGALRAG